MNAKYVMSKPMRAPLLLRSWSSSPAVCGLKLASFSVTLVNFKDGKVDRKFTNFAWSKPVNEPKVEKPFRG